MSHEDDRHDRVLDFGVVKTEYEWSVASQKFWEAFAELWFKWLSWTFAIGAVAFIADKLDSILLTVIQAISFAVMLLYFQFFFASVRIEPLFSNLKKVESKWKKTLYFYMMIVLGVIPFLVTILTVYHVIDLIKVSSK